MSFMLKLIVPFCWGMWNTIWCFSRL